MTQKTEQDPELSSRFKDLLLGMLTRASCANAVVAANAANRAATNVI